MNPIVFGKIKEENQKSTTCSKGVPSRRKMMIYRHNIVVNLSYTTIAGDIILSSVKLEKRFSIVEIASE